MLKNLKINNLATIKEIEVNFFKGFSVLSGETGAGKSILLDALSLIAGERADKSLIRTNENKLEVVAKLDEDLLISRQVNRKSSKGFINDNSASSQELKKIANELFIIYGQNFNLALLSEAEQCRRLDNFANLGDLVAKMEENFKKLQQMQENYQNLLKQEKDKKNRRDFLEFQIQELSEIMPLEKGEFAKLEQLQATLSRSDEILQKANHLAELIAKISKNSHNFSQELSNLSEIDPRFKESLEMAEQAKIYIKEAEDSLNQVLSHTENNPQKLQEIETKMGRIHALAKKYHQAPDELNTFFTNLNNEFSALDNIEASKSEMLEKIAKMQENCEKIAEKLSKERQKAAKNLSAAVLKNLAQLGMAKAKFFIKIGKIPLNSKGCDRIVFQLSANTGQNLEAVNKVASGGELSRLSLALELASLNDTNSVKTIIFDEVDSGIGGETALEVGKLLAKLGKKRQVLCITHLPQVAAFADNHYRIAKFEENQEVKTQIHKLNAKEKVLELARMLGDEKAQSARKHAENLIKEAAKNA